MPSKNWLRLRGHLKHLLSPCLRENKRKEKLSFQDMWSASFQEIPLHFTAYEDGEDTSVVKGWSNSYFCKPPKTTHTDPKSSQLTSDLFISCQKVAASMTELTGVYALCVKIYEWSGGPKLAELPDLLLCVSMELPVKRRLISRAHTAGLFGALGKLALVKQNA